MEGSQVFPLGEGKGPHERTGYSHQRYFHLEVVVITIMINPYHSLYVFIVDSDQD